MSTMLQAAPTLKARINFAANREDGGTFSNFDPSLNSQSLDTRDVAVRDARHLSTPPSLTREGFELHQLAFPDADMFDRDWVQTVYGPQISAYLKDLTGAAHVLPFRGYGVLIRDTGKLRPGRATAADFVHIDQTPASGTKHVERDTDPAILASCPHAQIYNVWRPLTAPPQDMPLAICDQYSLDQGDCVVGKAVEPGVPYATDTFTSVYNPAQRWYYFSDMTPDEMIVFKAWDNSPTLPIGCLHGAFRDTTVPAGTTPRISIESRFLCFFEE